MPLFEKIEGALDRGLLALDEAIAVARAAREVLHELRPTVAALPELLRSAQEVLALQRALARRQLGEP
jgi:hypothetical protein